MKRKGFVEVYLKDKGYGFVLEEQSGVLVKYFLHIRNVYSGTPRRGVRVLFNDGITVKGPIALDVEVLNGANSYPAGV